MYYLEHCKKVFSRCGLMLPEPVVKQLTGFRSVYGFSKEDAEEIKKSGASRGFSQYNVSSDTWLLDFDNNYKGVQDTLAWAKSKNLGYRLYESGGKGHHIEIPTTEKYDKELPFFHKEMAKALNTGADLSLYRHSSLYRLPGTIHDKTGKPKQLLEEEEGEFLLDIPVFERPQTCFNVVPLTGYEELKWGLRTTMFGIENCPGNGNRHALIWRTSVDLCKAGLSYETVLELMLFLNASWGDSAKEESEVQRSVKDGFKYAGTNQS